MAGMKLLERGKATLEICGYHRVTFAEGKDCPKCKEMRKRDKAYEAELRREYAAINGEPLLSTLKTCPAGRTVGA